MFKNLTILLIGLSLLILGSNFAVIYAEKFALSIGISEVVVSLTILALGTSLPELAATISAILKGKNQMVIGNIIGSNILNLVIIVPIIGIPYLFIPNALIIIFSKVLETGLSSVRSLRSSLTTLISFSI